MLDFVNERNSENYPKNRNLYDFLGSYACVTVLCIGFQIMRAYIGIYVYVHIYMS